MAFGLFTGVAAGTDRRWGTRFLRRPARAAGGGDRHRDAAGPHAPLAARRALHDAPEYVIGDLISRSRRHRPRLQGFREQSAGSHLPPLRSAAVAAGSHHGWRSRRPTGIAAFYEATQLAASPRRSQPLLRHAARRAGHPARAPRGSRSRPSLPRRQSSWRGFTSFHRSSVRPYFGTIRFQLEVQANAVERGPMRQSERTIAEAVAVK